MARIGYARCSAEDQSLDIQIARLKAEGCQPIRAEKMSGASRDGRTELAAILDFIREDDELIVLRADRLGRATRDVLNIVHELDQRGAFLTVLDPHVSTRGESGRIVLTVLGMVSQMERRFILERQREGIEAVKAKGLYTGGKRRLDRDKVLAMKAAGTGPAAIARALGCSRMQVYRIIESGNAPNAV
ncbi:recombinase family protein [Methylobacterium sp. J-092]|uniref:recombinase family protein n=1 Tax=Methylobacterium sp. J-092 TaxID=2836667 RepID=UPI001FBA5FCB|nr:recombinase family protein [Methylobacterium sp. J-092]MCJ2010420.1 recombinase family protein [Methylobacterium sp. J-092]